MTPTEALLESWDRQCKALSNLSTLLTPDLLEAKPSDDGWTVAFHLAHIHSTRRYWHMKAAGLEAPVGPSLFTVNGDDWIPSLDLAEIRERLSESQALVRNWVSEQIDSGAQQVGHYDHPVFYLQHMVWHEGWHFALLMLALRLAGHEPTEEWECENVWDLWRLPD
ncbi:MAG: DinB family protein [Armatimonadetes bacterium]|nr:DinB family protein [Armatimonadota bacterium]